MAIATNYKTGTVTVAAGGATVTGVGTSWLVGGIREGDIFSANGLTVSVAKVNSATSITLARPWPGGALAGAAYEIRYTPDATRVLASSREALIQMETLRDTVYANAYVFNNITDGLAATTNGQQFLINDNGVLKRYRRDSATSASLRVTYPSVDSLNDAINALNQAAADAAAVIADAVKADADRAAAAANDAVVAGQTFGVARQVGASLPARPNRTIVHFYTWDDPSDTGAKIMIPGDLWFQQPQPTVPDMPANASWSFDNARTGSSAALRIFAVPAASPPILTIEYRLNGGTWVSLPAVVGDHEITGLTGGSTATAELRYKNYLGNGIPTPARSAPISSAPFSDNFDRADGNLSSDARWTDVATGGGRRVAVSSGALRPTGTNEAVAAQVREYFRPDQMVEATIPATGTNTASGRGVFLYVRMPNGVHSGYRLRLGGASWWIERVINGVGTTLVGGSRPGTLPVQAQLRAVGRTLTASIDGVMVGSFTDNDPAAFLSGTVGVGFNAAGADGLNNTRIDNFTARNA